MSQLNDSKKRYDEIPSFPRAYRKRLNSLRKSGRMSAGQPR